MPVIHVKLQYNSQMGYNDSGGVFTTGSFNSGLKTDRVHIFRFTNLPIPKGSTINDATLYTMMSVKNATGTAYTFTQSVYIDPTGALTPWLDSTRNEWAGREPWSSQGSSTWAWQQGGPERQMHMHNVTNAVRALVGNANWTLAGGSATFLLYHPSVSNSDNIYLHSVNDGYSPVIGIDYTPPASDGKQTMVNVQENCNFTRNVNSAAAFSMEPYGFNAWFGGFVQPNYSITNSYAGNNPPAPPGGGNVLRVEATTGRSMVHWGVPVLEDGEWYNASCYTFIPTSAPADMGVSITSLGDTPGSGTVTTKGQWVRHDMSIIGNAFNPSWFAVQAGGSTWNNTAVFYVANVQITKGRQVKPYIDGNQSMSGVTYGWGGTNVNGFARATPPTATVNTMYDKARRKYYSVSWSYNQPDGHTQRSAEVQVRKVKHG